MHNAYFLFSNHLISKEKMTDTNWTNFSIATIITKSRPFTAFTVLTLFLCTLIFSSVAYADKKDDEKYERVYKEKYAAYIMDADTGLILHRENADKKLHPASLTKMMTLVMLFDALDRGKIKPYSRIRISENAASMVPSKLDLPAGSSIRVRDAITALTVKSANDIAVAVAEHLGGSEENFAKMMTQKAKTYGMHNTKFVNASGLHDPRQISTARDMAKLSRVILINYKKYYSNFSKTKFTYRGKTYKGHNKLMETYEGMDGMKTGYIRASGFNLASSAVRNNRRLIGVVFGGKTGTSRNKQMEILLDDAFAKINSLAIAQANVPVPSKKPIRGETTQVLALNYGMETPTPAAKPDTDEHDLTDPKKPGYSRWNMILADAGDSMFTRMIGEGDFDVHVKNRIETGLIAISSVLNEPIPTEALSYKTASIQPESGSAIEIKALRKKGDWAIQVGAFSSRENSYRAIQDSLRKLPSSLAHGESFIAPMETANGWIFRARLNGYTEEAAQKACSVLSDCLTIAPKKVYNQ